MIKGLKGKLKRGDIIWFNNRNEYSVHVQKGRRPAVILQNNSGNFANNTYIIAMITTKVKNTYLPIHVIVESVGLSRRSMVMLNQILTIDERDITDYVGPMPECYLKEIEKACSVSLGLGSEEAKVLEEVKAPIIAEKVAPKIESQKNLSISQSNSETKLAREIKSSDVAELLSMSDRFKIRNLYLDGQNTHYKIQGDFLTIINSESKMNVPLENLHILIDELNEVLSLKTK